MITGAGTIRGNIKGRVSSVLFAENAVKAFKRVDKQQYAKVCLRADKSLVIWYFSLGLCLHLLANPKQTFLFSAYQQCVNKSLRAFYK